MRIYIGFVSCTYKILVSHFKERTEDSSLVKTVKSNAAKYFTETLVFENMVQIKHKLGIYFHPTLKSLNKMTPIEKAAVHREVKTISLLWCY